MKIVLLGYMASGKTSIGRILAKNLDYKFIDLDDVIVDNEKNSLQDIFKLKGEIYFRKKESYYLDEVLKNNKNMVLSLGGGTPCYDNNMISLLNLPETKTVYLKTTIPTLAERLLKEKSKRPLISHIEGKAALTEFIGNHLFERSQYYSLADLIISTDSNTEQEIVEDIILELF